MLLCIAGTASESGEVYKSVDAEGHVVYSDHADPAAPSSVVHLEDAAAPGPPGLMHVCWTNCFTLEFDAGIYRRADGADETWSVERFTQSSFVLHRHDAPAAWNGFSTDVVYEGQIAGEHWVDVTVGGKPVHDVQAAWGGALESLPANNEERDRGYPSPPSTDDVRTAEAPPPLQDEVQPPCPDDGFLWTPGYWAWAHAGYHWVPGVWLAPPRVGMLWTPGYWNAVGALYEFHPGYWAAHVGYYGGINYGFGYGGVGFTGGRWVGGAFAYNSAVSNIDSTVVRHAYRETPPADAVVVSKVSYRGGAGGIATQADVGHPAAVMRSAAASTAPRAAATSPVATRSRAATAPPAIPSPAATRNSAPAPRSKEVAAPEAPARIAAHASPHPAALNR